MSEEKQVVEQLYFPTEAKEFINAEIPKTLIFSRSAGREQLRYITGSTVIDMLNIAFNHLWSWEITKQWVQESVDKKTKSMPEPQPQNPVAHVSGRLTVYLKQPDGSTITIVKEASGSKSIIGGQSEQEHIFKAAGTDALKKAASLLGIGLQLFRKEEEQYYYESQTSNDIWNEENTAAYTTELQYVRDFPARMGIQEAQMSYFYATFTKNAATDMTGIRPSTIKDFVAFLEKSAKDVGK